MSYSQDKYFKTGLKLNQVGSETLDEIIGLSLRKGQNRGQIEYKISVIFGLKGARLTRFLNNNVDLSDIG